MLSVYKKELKSYFTNMSGYIPIALILFMTGLIISSVSFKNYYPTMEYGLPAVTLILILAVPVLTMRSFSEEKRQKTDILLYSLPITTAQIVAGKYFAMMTVLTVPCVIMAAIPFILSLYGSVNILLSLCAILAFYLLCAAMTAICMFMSALTESQVIAAVLGAGVLALLYALTLVTESFPTEAIYSFIALTVIICLFALVIYLFTKNYWIAFTAALIFEAVMLFFYMKDNTKFVSLFPAILEKASLFEKLDNFVYNEIFDLPALIFYASIAFVFSYFTALVVEKKRWN